MSIKLPMLFGSTPDSIKSTDYKDEDNNTVKRYIWKFRNEKRNGVNLIIEPYTESDNLIWKIEVFEVLWDGDDYNESSNPIIQHTKDSFRKIIKCAENSIEQINNSDITEKVSINNIL